MPAIVTKYSLKVAMIIAATAWLTPYLHIDQPYWIIITIMAVMLPTVGATLERSKTRAVNTATGVLFGGLLAYAIGDHLSIILIATLALIFIACYFIQVDYAKAVFCISAFLVLVLAQIATSPWHFAFWRFTDTLIGVIATFIVSILLFPCWSKDAAPKTLQATLTHLNQLSGMILQTSNQNKPQEIEKIRALVIQSTQKLKKECNEMQYERRPSDKRMVIMESIILMLERLRFNLYLLMDLSIHPVDTQHLQELSEYSNSMFHNMKSAIDESCAVSTHPVKYHDITNNPYITQLIRNHISDLSALAQNITYYFR